jgi:hypothetical protein
MTIKRALGMAAFASLLGNGAQAQSLETVAASRQERGERSLSVHVTFGMGDFSMTRDQGSALYRANIVYDSERFDPVLEYANGQLQLGVDSDGDRLRNLKAIRGQRVDLSVSPRVPLSLDFEFGAGKADLDLGGLALERVEVRTGASEAAIQFSRPTTRPCERFEVEMGAAQLQVEGLGNSNCSQIDVRGAAGSLVLDFTGEWQHEGVTEANVELGLGDLMLRFPSNLGVSIEIERFLASFDADGFTKQGDRYISANYEQSASKLHIDLKAIVGDVEVEWIPGR